MFQEQERARPWSARVVSRNPIVHDDVPNERQRPQSACIRSLGAFPGAPLPQAGPEIVSYFQSKGDDLGRSVTQHKPLNKGPHAQPGLAKSFADTEHGQRPRVWAPAEVHKPCSRALTTSDIEGAQSRPKAAFITHARDTNPVDPRYKLASCQPLTTDPILQTQKSDPSNGTQATLRDPIQVHDIEGSSPAAYKQNRAQLRTSLDVKDIEGAAVGWKPPFRSHVGVRLRDPGLDVSDINCKTTYGKLAPRRPDDPLVWTTGTLNNAAAPSVTHSLGATAALRAKARPASAGARLDVSAHEPRGLEFTGLPVFQQARPQDGITSAPTFGDLHAREVRDQQRAASALATMQQRNAARIDARVYMAQVERRRLNNAQAHQLRVQVADEQRAARKAGEEATAALGDCIMDSQKNVGALYHAWQARDREACGKLTSAEFGQAMHALHVQVPPQVLTDLVRGLADAAGFVPYRELARAMVRRTQEKQRRDSVRRPASSLAKQHSQQQQPQQPSNHTPPTAGAVVSAPELLPQHAITKSSTPLVALSKPVQPPSTSTAPVSLSHPSPASTSQPAQPGATNGTSPIAAQTGLPPGGVPALVASQDAHTVKPWMFESKGSAQNEMDTPTEPAAVPAPGGLPNQHANNQAVMPIAPVTQAGGSDVQSHPQAFQAGPSVEAPAGGESAGAMLNATKAQPQDQQQHKLQAAQQQRSPGGDAVVAGKGLLQPGAGGVAASRASAEGTAAAVSATVAHEQGREDTEHQAVSNLVLLQCQQEDTAEGSAMGTSNHHKTALDLQAVLARPKSSQGAPAGGIVQHGAPNTSPRKSVQAWATNKASNEVPSISRPASALWQGKSDDAALETARIEAALQAGIAPPGVQILGPEGAKYFTYKGRTYWFAGNEPASNFAQASKDFKPTREGPRPGGRNHMTSQPPVPYFDAPLTKGMTLEPNSNGQKEANNGLLAAKPGGGSLGATLYHAGGHGAHTFIASPTNTHAKMRCASAHGHRRPVNPQHPLSSSITSVANAGAGPSMQRLEKATMRDELRAVRLLC